MAGANPSAKFDRSASRVAGGRRCHGWLSPSVACPASRVAGASERSGHAIPAGRRETGDVFGPVRLAPDGGGGGFHRALPPVGFVNDQGT